MSCKIFSLFPNFIKISRYSTTLIYINTATSVQDCMLLLLDAKIIPLIILSCVVILDDSCAASSWKADKASDVFFPIFSVIDDMFVFAFSISLTLNQGKNQQANE